MKTSSFYWFVAFTFLSILSNRAFAQQTLINADALLDVSSGAIVDNVAVLVENNKIIRVGPQGSINPADATVIDLKGMTLVPGLMDMHVHLTSDAADNFLAAKGNSIRKK
jgi:imidazolonepropionase-like amidohydrolase